MLRVPSLSSHVTALLVEQGSFAKTRETFVLAKLHHHAIRWLLASIIQQTSHVGLVQLVMKVMVQRVQARILFNGISISISYASPFILYSILHQ